MKNTTKFADPMLAFSDQGGHLGECQLVGVGAGGGAPASPQRRLLHCSDPFSTPAPPPVSLPTPAAHSLPVCSCGGQGVAKV